MQGYFDPTKPRVRGDTVQKSKQRPQGAQRSSYQSEIPSSKDE